jgi:hypothetical protein
MTRTCLNCAGQIADLGPLAGRCMDCGLEPLTVPSLGALMDEVDNDPSLSPLERYQKAFS